jgi:hypothetical protein
MEQQERDRATECLARTRDGLMAAIDGLSEAQMKFKASDARWSVAETLEHIARSEEAVYRRVMKGLEKDPAPPPDHDRTRIDDIIRTRIATIRRPVSAPDSMKPEGEWTPAESLSRFLDSRARTIAAVKDEAGLRDHAWDSPFGMKLDAYQWLLFNGSHSERHTRQILEVKADPNFPIK